MYIKATAKYYNGKVHKTFFYYESEYIVWSANIKEMCRKKNWLEPEIEVIKENRPFTFAEAANAAANSVLGEELAEIINENQIRLILDLIEQWTK